ncbi:hypothetical protein QUF81_08030 [Peribacillus simplex]|jgi:hypothetical protein|uniref:Group-specific protein n=1 Tax=Peribacillus simplex TaxID=1478 RepID=A0AAW7I978_9BACI|nr:MULTISPECIES: hypothetical protein [Peribacillus]SNT46684.1 hypothetical protein SAMN05444672_12841 [Bacillus sp. OK838]AMM94577.1 hypothetical protein UP17_20565 [Peribacillus simplex]MDF9759685.1 hypothetical protein [Peribacillus simplex]MDM5210882.1 hypothetical protein [Peribacillus sp. NJ4]MDM5221188.1 hypothetical protein [Peribacillus sp. NJ11]
MTISVILVVAISLVALVGTLSLTGKSDSDYSAATRGNLLNLSYIYIGLALVLTVGIIYFVIKLA